MAFKQPANRRTNPARAHIVRLKNVPIESPKYRIAFTIALFRNICCDNIWLTKKNFQRKIPSTKCSHEREFGTVWTVAVDTSITGSGNTSESILNRSSCRPATQAVIQ